MSRCLSSSVCEQLASANWIFDEKMVNAVTVLETVLLIDSRKDQHSIDVHHASPMTEKITELREKYDLHMKAERYMSDETGVPATDKAFIKE